MSTKVSVQSTMVTISLLHSLKIARGVTYWLQLIITFQDSRSKFQITSLAPYLPALHPQYQKC